MIAILKKQCHIIGKGQKCSNFDSSIKELINQENYDKQSCSSKVLKLNLEIGEITIHEFSEYYSIIHNKVQGFHWNTVQATLHSSVNHNSQNKMTHTTDLFLTSHCLKHDIVAVHLFQSQLCYLLSVKLKDLTTIFYISDGLLHCICKEQIS